MKRAFNVVGGKTLEICLVRTWAREKKEVSRGDIDEPLRAASLKTRDLS